jgi:hypothetical protein
MKNNTVKPALVVTSFKQSPFPCPVIENFIWIEFLLRGHLSYKATFSLFQWWPLNTHLTVYSYAKNIPWRFPQSRRNIGYFIFFQLKISKLQMHNVYQKITSTKSKLCPGDALFRQAIKTGLSHPLDKVVC